MREARVLDDASVAAEVARLCGQLRAARLQAGFSVRELAAAAEVAPSTLTRIEAARVAPTYRRAARLAGLSGQVFTLDDGTARGRTHTPADPPGWWANPLVLGAGVSELDGLLYRPALRIGAELWWARHHELDPPLSAAAAAARLGMSVGTLRGIEHGGRSPDLAAMVRVAGLSGRRLALTLLHPHGWPLGPWEPPPADPAGWPRPPSGDVDEAAVGGAGGSGGQPATAASVRAR